MQNTITNLDVIGETGSEVATTQAAYPFNSYCRFAGHVLAAGAGGLMRLGCNDFDGVDIAAYFETFATKLGYDGNKRLRFIYLMVETAGMLKIIFTVDKVITRTLTVTPDNTGPQFIKVPVGRDAAGAFWTFRIENVDGCWFSVEELSCLPIKLSKGRRVMRI